MTHQIVLTYVWNLSQNRKYDIICKSLKYICKKYEEVFLLLHQYFFNITDNISYFDHDSIILYQRFSTIIDNIFYFDYDSIVLIW